MNQELMNALAKAVTDATAREQCLADPRAYLAANGFVLPSFVTVNVVEIEESSPSITLGFPPMLDMDELSEEALAGVAGGGASCCCSLV
jgi:hypothetical protein